jgi:predicted glycosyltransferase
MSEGTVWVDLSTAPDPLFFRPLIRRLNELGHPVWITVREYGETSSVAARCGLDFDVVGHHGGHSTMGKALAIGRRAVLLSGRARTVHPRLAVSFNSYAQALAARICGIPFATLTDYEYQPANHLAFRLARRVIVPDDFDRRTLRRQGAPADRVVSYRGLKEHVTLSDFTPDSQFPSRLAALGVPSDRLVVTMRPPATNSLYHRFENDWFYEVLSDIARRQGVVVVVLARYPAQAVRVRSLGLPDVIIPDAVLDGLNLVYWSDLVVSAGGSMNREAAVLGTPACTVFAGHMAGVDRALIASGALVHLRTASDLAHLVVHENPRRPIAHRWPSPVNQIVTALLDVAGPP